MHQQSLLEERAAYGPTAGKLITGGAWATAGKVVTMAATLVLNAAVARLLSPDDVGAYFLIFSIVPFAMSLGGLGLKRAIVKLVADRTASGRPGQARFTVTTTLLWSALGSLVVGVVFASGAGQWLARSIFSMTALGDLAGAIALLIVLTTVVAQIAETFRGFHDIRLATITNGLANSVLPAALVSIVWLVGTRLGLSGIVALHLAALTVTLVIAGWLLSRSMTALGASQPYPRPAILSLALPMMVTDLAFILQARIGLWIVAVFLLPSDVALYGAATRVMLLVGMPLLLANAVVPPIIAEMYALGKRRPLERVLRGISAFAAVVSVLMLLVLVVFGRPILVLVFGGFYDQAWTVLVILSAGQVIGALAGSCGLTLMMTGNQTSLMAIAFASTALQAVVGLGLGRAYGIEGVALAVTGVLAAQNIAMLTWARFKTGVWTYASFPGLVDGGRTLLRSRI